MTVSSKFVDSLNVSVLISTYNRPKALNLVLDAMSRQNVKPQQIVIGDDGSTPATREVIDYWRRQGLPLEHCWHEDRGFRKSVIMNTAIQHATGYLTIFLDGDCIPSPTFVADHIRLHEPGFILAGPRILLSERYTNKLENDPTLSPFGRSVHHWLGLFIAGHINRLLPLIRLPDGGWRHRRPLDWKLVRGCNFSVALEGLQFCDGFEEKFSGWGLEDSDLVVRLINSGLRVKNGRFSAPVLHLWHKHETRERLSINESVLQSALGEKRIKAIAGVSSHFNMGRSD